VPVFTLYFSAFVGIFLNFKHVIVGLYEFALRIVFYCAIRNLQIKKKSRIIKLCVNLRNNLTETHGI